MSDRDKDDMPTWMIVIILSLFFSLLGVTLSARHRATCEAISAIAAPRDSLRVRLICEGKHE